MNTAKQIASVLSVSGLSLGAAFAQGGAPAGQRPAEPIDEIVVTEDVLDGPAITSSRIGLTPLDTPASVHVLTGDMILDRGDLTVQDAVGRIVGVVDQGSSGNGGTAVSARGFNGVNSIMRLYDGIQMFVAAGTMTFPADTWTVERIEVLGGPSSSLYGTGAIGGIVNVIPRKPNNERFVHSYRLMSGSNGVFRAAVDSTGPLGDNVSYRMSLSDQSSDGYADRAESESLALSASLRIDMSPQLSLTLSEDFADQYPATNTSIPLINGRFDESLARKNYNVLDAERHYKDSWTQAKVDWAPSEALAIRSTTYYLVAERRWFGSGGVSYQASSGMVQRQAGTDLSHDLRQYGNSTVATLTHDLGSRENTLAVGVDFNRLRFNHVYWIATGNTWLDPWNPDVGTFSYLPGAYSYINLFHANQYSMFAENDFTLTARTSLLAGVRKDHYDVDRNERLTGIASAATFDPSSWRIGLRHELRSGMRLYGNFSTATDPAGSVGNMTAAAQRMRMQDGEQLEVGLKQLLDGGRGEWTLALYDITKNNLQVPVPDQPGVTQQVGQQSSKGVELSGSFAVTPRLRVDANATVLDANFDEFAETVSNVFVSRNGNTPPNVPEKTANFWVNWRATTLWQVRGGVRHIGERYADNANTSVLEPYTIFDAGVRRSFGSASMVDLRIYNAADRFYTPRGSSATAWSPAPLRTYELSWTSSF